MSYAIRCAALKQHTVCRCRIAEVAGDAIACAVKIQIALELFQASVLKNQTLDENTQDLILKIIMSIPESPAALIAAMRQMAKTQKLSANSEEQIRKFE